MWSAVWERTEGQVVQSLGSGCYSKCNKPRMSFSWGMARSALYFLNVTLADVYQRDRGRGAWKKLRDYCQNPGGEAGALDPGSDDGSRKSQNIGVIITCFWWIQCEGQGERKIKAKPQVSGLNYWMECHLWNRGRIGEKQICDISFLGPLLTSTNLLD